MQVWEWLKVQLDQYVYNPLWWGVFFAAIALIDLYVMFDYIPNAVLLFGAGFGLFSFLAVGLTAKPDLFYPAVFDKHNRDLMSELLFAIMVCFGVIGVVVTVWIWLFTNSTEVYLFPQFRWSIRGGGGLSLLLAFVTWRTIRDNIRGQTAQSVLALTATPSDTIEATTHDKAVAADSPEPAQNTTEASADEAATAVEGEGETEPEEQVSSWFEIRLPRQTEWVPQNALAFMQRIFDVVGDDMAALSIVARRSGITWQIQFVHPISKQIEPELITLATALYPAATVTNTTEIYREVTFPFYRRSMVLQRTQNKNFFDPYISVGAFKSSDPLTLIIQAIPQLLPDEELALTVTFTQVYQMSAEQVFPLLNMSRREIEEVVEIPRIQIPSGKSFWQANALEQSFRIVGWGFGKALTKGRIWWANKQLEKQFVPRFPEKESQIYQTKLAQKLAHASIGLYMDSPEKERLSILPTVAKQVMNLSGDSPLQAIDGMDEIVEITDAQLQSENHPVWLYANWHEAMAMAHQQKGKKQPEFTGPFYDFTLTAAEVASSGICPTKVF
ncbi:MAG: hypothetical protein R3E39_08150 [Anaerolineae bacterium]